MGRTSIFLAVLDILFLLGWVRCFAGPCRRSPPSTDGVCARLIRPLGYPCSEYTVETKDGFLLSVQRIPHGRRSLGKKSGPPVFLQHGLFQVLFMPFNLSILVCKIRLILFSFYVLLLEINCCVILLDASHKGGDTWFVNSVEESLGFILADDGFDVWVGSVRGTHWSYGHIDLSEKDKEFWDWSWQELAQYDLLAMINFVYSTTNSKVFYVGHSQGTIMALAAFTIPDVVRMIEAAALLCPISYLDHISSSFVLRAVGLHLDQMLISIGIHQLNFRSDMGVQILDSVCDGHMDCNNLLSAITGENCCFNVSRIDHYLEYEPHPSSTKNLNHLFQMIRKGTFAKYDYGWLRNLLRYGQLHPPAFNLAEIPASLPIWMGYGGSDALADVTDVQRTIKELKSEPELLYIDKYGHIDFILSVKAKDDVYGELIRFFRSQGWPSMSY